jgi:tetratricopeptide (TPR) repeat protein
MSLRLMRGTCLAVAFILLAGAAADISGQQDSGPSTLAPAREGLDSIVIPQLEALEESVANHLREARSTFEKTARGASAQDLGDAYGTLGRVFHAYEFFDAAEACYRNASRLKPNDVDWLHLRAYLYQQTGRFDEAVNLYVAARRAAPNDYAATIHLGEAYVALGRTADARVQFESMVTRYPAAANAGLGEAALREGRYAEAIRYFDAALERIPDAGSLHYSLAMAYRGLGRLSDARSHLQKRGAGGVRVADPIVDVLPTLVRGERAFVMQGRRAYEAGQFRAAAAAFRQAVNTAPASVTPRVNLGLTLAQLGDDRGAIEQFETVVRLDPVNVAAHSGIGQLLARERRDADAVDHLRIAFQLAPDDAQVKTDLIAALLRLERKDEALEVLTRARSVEPDDEAMLVSLAILLADRQRYREAIALLDDGHRRFPDRAPTATTLARLLASSPDRSLRDGRRALDLATEIYQAQPRPVYGETVALALAELERCDEAADWMRRAIAEAERAKDRSEATRLSSEAARYAKRPCRP